MYIQPAGRGMPEMPFSVPRDYSGSAFRQEPPPPPSPPPPADIAVPPPPPLAFEGEEAELPEEAGAEGSEAVAEDAEAAFAEHESEPPALPTSGGGLLSRIPFLSSLMPPRRGRSKEKGGLPDWLLIAALILLFGGEGDEDDVLPFLLLLLLWN